MSLSAASVPSEVEGLLSLSLAAANAAPMPVARDTVQESSFATGSFNGPNSFGAGGASSNGTGTKAHPTHKHRRISSTGQARRRLSDAREAASRPSPVTISTAAAALTSLAKLSLSGTPPPQTSTSLVSASGVMNTASSRSASVAQDVKHEESDTSSVKTDINGTGISVTNSKNGAGKKRGTIFKCESCSKVYRHPSCLIKHRWEHSPHWREASKFLLSKHQQVQLLEAAAILSHLAPSARGGTSLPEDRSLWPSYLSGGLLPPPNSVNMGGSSSTSTKPTMSSFPVEQPAPFPTSSSVPASSLLSSSTRSGPRLHDYSVPTAGGITQLRPGVLAVPTGSDSSAGTRASPVDDAADVPIQRSAAMPVPMPNAYREHDTMGYSLVSRPSDGWSSPVSVGFAQSSFRSSMSASAFGHSYSEGTGGWSLPRSSVRSSSRSRSGSASEGDYVDGEEYGDGMSRYGFSARSIKRDEGARAVGVGYQKIEEEWDGMELEMEM